MLSFIVYYLCFWCLLLLMSFIELCMGRKVGTLTLTAPNSRGLIDVYSLSHLIHGFVFYWFYFEVMGFSFNEASLCAVATEVAWEIFENTPLVINRYRKTVAVDYAGDTVANSTSDVVMTSVGFCVAVMLPWWVTCVMVIVFELLALYLSRDNLMLNILMLIYPFDKIKKWQRAKAQKTNN